MVLLPPRLVAGASSCFGLGHEGGELVADLINQCLVEPFCELEVAVAQCQLQAADQLQLGDGVAVVSLVRFHPAGDGDADGAHALAHHHVPYRLAHARDVDEVRAVVDEPEVREPGARIVDHHVVGHELALKPAHDDLRVDHITLRLVPEAADLLGPAAHTRPRLGQNIRAGIPDLAQVLCKTIVVHHLLQNESILTVSRWMS